MYAISCSPESETPALAQEYSETRSTRVLENSRRSLLAMRQQAADRTGKSSRYHFPYVVIIDDITISSPEAGIVRYGLHVQETGRILRLEHDEF